MQVRLQAQYGPNPKRLRDIVGEMYTKYGWKNGIMRGYWVSAAALRQSAERRPSPFRPFELTDVPISNRSRSFARSRLMQASVSMPLALLHDLTRSLFDLDAQASTPATSFRSASCRSSLTRRLCPYGRRSLLAGSEVSATGLLGGPGSFVVLTRFRSQTDLVLALTHA